MGVSVFTSSAQNSQRIEKRDERKKKQKEKKKFPLSIHPDQTLGSERERDKWRIIV